MKRLIRLCRRCKGEGTLWSASLRHRVMCPKCFGRGQTGEDVRLSEKDFQANEGQLVLDTPTSVPKFYDTDPLGPAQMGCFNTLTPSVAPYLPTADYNTAVLNQIPQGPAWGQRVGSTIKLRNVRIMGFLQAFLLTEDIGADGEATITCATVKMFVIYQRRPQLPTSMPPWDMIFVANDIMAFQDLESIEDFKILYTWSGSVSGGAFKLGSIVITGDGADGGGDMFTYDVGRNQICFDFTVPLEDRLTRWTAADATGDYAQMLEGGLYLYAQCDKSVVNSTTPVLTLSTRLEFTD